jgi:hypothetical protein
MIWKRRIDRVYEYHVGIAGYIHLFWFGVFLPLLYVRSARKLLARDYPPRLKQFSVVILSQSSFVAISIPVAHAEYIDLWAKPNDWPKSLLIGAAVLIVMIASMAPGWRRDVGKHEWNLYYFMPRTPMEKVFWAGVSLFAGFSEEIVYSGVMFSLVWISSRPPLRSGYRHGCLLVQAANASRRTFRLFGTARSAVSLPSISSET